MPEFKTVRGMRDFLPQEAQVMRRIEYTARKVAELYGYNEIITPVVESYELLSAKTGEEVRSRMFTFKDLGDRNVALRPEFTASVARLVASTLRNEPKPFRLFCVGSIYRYDEPQRGRYREFWQSNYELMGSSRPEADAEILMLTQSLMENVGLKKYAFKIGHVGVLKGIFSQEGLSERIQDQVMQLMDKKQYDDAFKIVEEAGVSDKGMKILRELLTLTGNDVFDVVGRMRECVTSCEQAVAAADNLKEILKLVSGSGCKIDMTVDAGFARGLEYYTGMIFEVFVPSLSIALGGGGRYDKLIELFGGEPTAAVGVAHGIDRIMLALQEQEAPASEKRERTVMVFPISEQVRGEALSIAHSLRNAGIAAEVEVMGRKMAKALEDADRRGIDYAVIVGERELKQEAIMLRNLKERKQDIVRIKELAQTMKNQEPT